MCDVDGCARTSLARGLCSTHYARSRSGRPLGGPIDVTDARAANRVPAPELFFRHVDKTAGCWLWTGSVRSGYGTFQERVGRAKSVSWLAHRYSYTLAVGPIEPGMVLDHLCRTPTCVRPDHLEAVTQQVNVVRGSSPGGTASRTNRCKRGHEFTPDNTVLHPNRFGRGCKTCRNLSDRARIDREAV